MPVAIDASTPARVTASSSTSSITTAAFNPPALSVIVLTGSFDGSAGGNPTLTASNNGAATTWVPIARRNDADSGGNPGVVEGFLTVLASGRTGMTVTVTSSVANEGSLKAYVLTGADQADPLGNVIEGSSATNTMTTTSLTSEKANSLGFVANVDSSNFTAAPTSSDTTYDGYFVSGSHYGGAGYKTLGAQGSTATFNIDAQGTGAALHNWIAFEIKESSVVFQGAVALTVNKTLTASGVVFVLYQGAVALTANKTLTVAGAITQSGAVALTVNKTLAVAGTVVPAIQGAVALTVNKTILANAGQQGAVAMTVNKTLIAAGNVTLKAAQAALVVAGSLVVSNARLEAFANIVLDVTYTLSANGTRSRSSAIVTRYERPPYEHPFRVIVQEILTGEIVEWDLPVQEDFTYTRQLSGPTVMDGSFKPEIISVQELGLDGYAYWFHVEINEEIRASAIFLPPRYEEQGLTFSCEGFSATPHYTTWESSFVGVGVDVFTVVRNIWNHHQAHPLSNYGVTVSNQLSGRTVGEGATSAEQIERTNAANAIASRLLSGDPIFEDWTWAGADPAVGKWNEFLQQEFKKVTGISAVTWLQAYADSYPIEEAKPYELQWWEAPNCGESLDELAQQTPFDYRERVTWNADKNDVLMYLDLGYPRMGVPKPDLVFNEENIIEVVPVQEDDSTYASEVIVIGAGEGAATVRGYAAEPFSNRVRKTYVHTDKKITTQDRANAVAKSELGLRRGRLFEITEIVVRAYHQNAPIGEYDVGDDIYIEVDIPWLNEPYGAWYRIVAISVAPSTDIVRISVVRSDSYRYPSVETVA